MVRTVLLFRIPAQYCSAESSGHRGFTWYEMHMRMHKKANAVEDQLDESIEKAAA
jgi:hypothetical protein